MVYENYINVTEDRKLKCGLCGFIATELMGKDGIYTHLEEVEKVRMSWKR